MLDKSSYVAVDIVIAINMANCAKEKALRQRADYRRERLTAFIEARKWWLKWFPVCRLWLSDLNTLDEAECDPNAPWSHRFFYGNAIYVCNQVLNMCKYTDEDRIYLCDEHIAILDDWSS